MARRWVVLTADRDPHAANEIITYTEWDGLMAAADEVIYTDPVDADGNAVDALWKVGGSVILAAGVYTYADSSFEPSLIDRQRGQIYDGYKYWQIHGRTGHWRGIRSHRVNMTTQRTPLDSTDKWGFHCAALGDQGINGVFPISGPLSAVDLQTLVDHIVFIYRNLGPTWYGEQTNKIAPDIGEPTQQAGQYAALDTVGGTSIYFDGCSALGVPRTPDGMYLPMAVSIRAGFNPELRDLGN